MRKCPKCSREFDDEFSICRTCGAILEAVEKPVTMEAGVPPLHAEPSLSAGEPSTRPKSARKPQWPCPRCKESVPDTFEACWNCGTSRDGVEDPDFHREPSEDEQDVLTIHDVPTEASAAAQPGDQCPKCGSSKLIPRARVVDQGQQSTGDLRVVVCGAPDALVFKDRLYGKLSATICGECGHVELQVENPRALYEKYRQSLE